MDGCFMLVGVSQLNVVVVDCPLKVAHVINTGLICWTCAKNIDWALLCDRTGPSSNTLRQWESATRAFCRINSPI